jgi:hypothetical protein
MAGDGGSVLARGEEAVAYIVGRKAVRDASLCVKVTESRYGPRHGRSTAQGDGDVRRVRRRAIGWAVRRGHGSVAARGCGTRGANEEGWEGGSTTHGPAGRSRPRHAGPAEPRRGDMRRRRALERHGTHPNSA